MDKFLTRHDYRENDPRTNLSRWADLLILSLQKLGLERNSVLITTFTKSLIILFSLTFL